ncbi:MAG: YqjF family protein [Gemmatimonadaceae bacterium]
MTRRRFLVAEWRELAMLNYEIAPAVLRPLVPAGTELEQWGGGGMLYVSVVGFRFVSTRVFGIAVPGHVDFEEVNLRFYVRRREAGEWRRGVVFVREIVPRQAIAWMARLWYNEPYRALPMRHRVERRADGAPLAVAYEWQQAGRWEGLSLRTTGEAAPLAAGSEAEFITEHYWGYTRQRDGSAIEYRVEHPPWRVWGANEARLDCDAAALYGPAFAEALAAPVRSAFLAEGSEVTVFRPRRLPREVGPE